MALASYFAFATASPFLEARQNGVTCQTSDGSPTTEDVTAVINQLHAIGGNCYQTNNQASLCTTTVSHNSAAIAVCGEVDTDATVITCEQVANYANQIQQTCLSVGRAGGTYTVSNGKRVEVVHSD